MSLAEKGIVELPSKIVLVVLIIITSLVLQACEDRASPEISLQEANLLMADGEYEAAVSLLRNAARSDPNNAELRLLLVSSYLKLDQGLLALSTLDQALKKGIAPSRAGVPRATALFIEERFADVLAVAEQPGMTTSDVASLRYWHVKAQRARSVSDDGFDATLTQGYLSLWMRTKMTLISTTSKVFC